jgi:catechol-2,3-dioxygenase
MLIKELLLHTSKLEETVLFYRDVLGFGLKEENSDSISFHAGITLFKFSASHLPQLNYHFAFTIPSNQIADAFNWASERVDILDVAPNEKIADFSRWDAKAFYFIDNNNNIVEFIGRFDLQEVSDQPFNASSILSVSEIGLVTTDVSNTCQMLHEKFNLNFFSKQKPMSNFAAVGDDHGLFIVVTENRPWFPTQVHSTKSPLKVVFETNTCLKNVLDFD